MALYFDFVVDRMVRDKIYPHLTSWQAEPYTPAWRDFGNHWPYTVPLRVQEYCVKNAIEINVHSIDNFPPHCFYPVALAFFDFGIDYFALLPRDVYAAVAKQRLQVLFFYHEGDNPVNIKQRLDSLAWQHSLPLDCYKFVSANTAADNLDRFVYFCDFELWYRYRNVTPALNFHNKPRTKEFTALNRLHKSWRATFMTHLLPELTNSYWSYCETGTIVDQENPLEIDSVQGLRELTEQFLAAAPYQADDLSNSERNNHAHTVEKFFNDSYMHIVIETHWDADQSGGAFLTEKTFKPIKHSQPFLIAGCTRSLATLRDLGYQTFDSILNNHYDTVIDNTQRWHCLHRTIKNIRPCLADLVQDCRHEIAYNQQLFLAPKTQRLNNLLEKIHEQN